MVSKTKKLEGSIAWLYDFAKDIQVWIKRCLDSHPTSALTCPLSRVMQLLGTRCTLVKPTNSLDLALPFRGCGGTQECPDYLLRAAG